MKMIARLTLFTTLACFGCSAFAQVKVGQQVAMEYGAGIQSCGEWQTSQSVEFSAWILGFWSGLNAFSNGNRAVGRSTDSMGIVETVRKACRDDPAARVGTVTREVYKKMASRNR